MTIQTPIIIRYSLNELANSAAKILSICDGYKVIALVGDLGAGKTTLVRACAQQLGVYAPVTSPTFNYVNQYTTADGKLLYHFDLYRIANFEQFMALGLEEFLYRPNALAFVEWPAVIISLLTHDACTIQIEYEDAQDERQLTISSGVVINE